MDAILASRPSSLGLRDFPHIFMPPGAIPFSRVGFKSGIAPAGTFNLLVGQQILIPVQQVGWLTQIAISLASYGEGQTWSLLQNGVPLRDYTNVPAPIGAPETPVTRHIQLFPQQPVSLSFFNGGAVNLSVAWSMYGWYYPQKVGR